MIVSIIEIVTDSSELDQTRREGREGSGETPLGNQTGTKLSASFGNQHALDRIGSILEALLPRITSTPSLSQIPGCC